MTRPDRFRRWMALFLLLLSGAIQAQKPALQPLPLPALDRMEEAVRVQLREKRAAIDALAGTADTNSAKLLRAYEELGRLALAYDLMELSAACWQNAAVLDPANFRWPYLAGFVDQLEGRFEAASAAFERAAELDAAEDPYIPIFLRRAQVELERGHDDTAREHFQKSLAADVLRAAAHHGLGQVAAAQGDYEAAVRHLEAALDEQPAATSLHHPLGIAYRQLGDLERARDHLRQRGDSEVSFPDPVAVGGSTGATGAGYHHTLGTEASSAGDRRRAVEEFRKALNLEPDLVGTRLALARELALIGQIAAALAEYRAAVERAPENALARYELGRRLLETARGPEALSEAEGHFRQAVLVAPDYKVAFFGLSLVLGRTGRGAEAVDVLIGLAERFPDDREVARRLATALAQAGRPQDALARLEAVLARDPRDGQVLVQVARLLAMTGPSGAASRRVERAVDEGLAPATAAEAYLELSVVARQAGDEKAAIVHLRAALGHDPASANAYFNLAMLLGGQGDMAAAADNLGRVLELKPGDREARFQRAVALRELGRLEPAVVELEYLVVDSEGGGSPSRGEALEALISVLAANGDTAFALGRLRPLRERLSTSEDVELARRVAAILAEIEAGPPG